MREDITWIRTDCHYDRLLEGWEGQVEWSLPNESGCYLEREGMGWRLHCLAQDKREAKEKILLRIQRMIQDLSLVRSHIDRNGLVESFGDVEGEDM